jgi:hypothetical protein
MWLSKFAMAMSVVPSEGKQNLRVPAMEARSAFMRTCRARIVVWGRILRVSGILGWKDSDDREGGVAGERGS